jgi:selenocysteine lyase/cysteine desulfurase
MGLETIRAREAMLLEYLWAGLSRVPRIKLYGTGDSRYQTCVVSFNLGDMPSTDLARLLDEKYRILLRAGMHCAILAHQALGTEAQGTCRLSPGYFSTRPQIDYVVSALEEIAGAMKI